MFVSPFATTADTQLLGYLENAVIYPGALPMEAKLDTGADHSSLDARLLKRKRTPGGEWIVFEIENKAGAKARLERPVIRVARIRRHDDKTEERPVVMLDICLGNVKRTVEVNLANRKRLSYKMLIGRSFLAGNTIIDPNRTFTTKPACN